MALDLKKKKKLVAANDSESMNMGLTERLLKDIADLYEPPPTDVKGGTIPSLGLTGIGQDSLVQIPLHKPRKKVTVMIVGNHSAGKSSFINWYVGETIQRTGVAIETRGFSFVTSGKRRETLKGEATLIFYDSLKDFEQFEGIVPNLFTEVCTSKEKNFSCVDFIDTPGLVDGDIQYPFDVDGSIVWLANHVDQILVFFDPIGQALTARTMDVISRLSEIHNEKIHFYMSKADQVDREDDRQRVLIQITQNVTARIKSTHAFKLPTFYLPNAPDDPRPAPSIPNAIEEVCEEIDKTIKLTVQKNLGTLKTDCQRILDRIEERKKDDVVHKRINRQRQLNGILLLLGMYAILGVMLVVTLRHLVANFVDFADMLSGLIRKVPSQAEFLRSLLGLSNRAAPSDPTTFNYTMGVLGGLCLVAFIASKYVWRPVPVMTKKDLERLKQFEAHVASVLKVRENLYKEYFKQLTNQD